VEKYHRPGAEDTKENKSFTEEATKDAKEIYKKER